MVAPSGQVSAAEGNSPADRPSDSLARQWAMVAVECEQGNGGQSESDQNDRLQVGGGAAAEGTELC